MAAGAQKNQFFNPVYREKVQKFIPGSGKDRVEKQREVNPTGREHEKA